MITTNNCNNWTTAAEAGSGFVVGDDDASATAMANGILTTGRLPVLFPTLPKLVQTKIEDYFKKHLQVLCPSCRSPHYVQYRYLNNKYTSRTLQPRFICNNSICSPPEDEDNASGGNCRNHRSAVGGNASGPRRKVYHFTFNIYRSQKKKTEHTLTGKCRKEKRMSKKGSCRKNGKLAIEAAPIAPAPPNVGFFNVPSSYYSYNIGNNCYIPDPFLSAPSSGCGSGGGSMLPQMQHLDYQLQQLPLQPQIGDGGGFSGGAPTSVNLTYLTSAGSSPASSCISGDGAMPPQMQYLDYQLQPSQMTEFEGGQGGGFGGAPNSVVSIDLTYANSASYSCSGGGLIQQQMQYGDYRSKQPLMIECEGGASGGLTSTDLSYTNSAPSSSCRSGDASTLQQTQYRDYELQQLRIEVETGGGEGAPASVVLTDSTAQVNPIDDGTTLTNASAGFDMFDVEDILSLMENVEMMPKLDSAAASSSNIAYLDSAGVQVKESSDLNSNSSQVNSNVDPNGSYSFNPFQVHDISDSNSKSSHATRSFDPNHQHANNCFNPHFYDPPHYSNSNSGQPKSSFDPGPQFANSFNPRLDNDNYNYNTNLQAHSIISHDHPPRPTASYSTTIDLAPRYPTPCHFPDSSVTPSLHQTTSLVPPHPTIHVPNNYSSNLNLDSTMNPDATSITSHPDSNGKVTSFLDLSSPFDLDSLDFDFACMELEPLKNVPNPCDELFNW